MKKAALQRIDRLDASPVVGDYYLVPTVTAKYFARIAPWPVLGPQHDDVEIFGFRLQHYHIDPRFLSRREAKSRIEHASTSYVLHGEVDRAFGESTPLPDIVWRKLRCNRAGFSFSTPWRYRVDLAPLTMLRNTFAGRQCRRNAGGFVCPHKNAPLGSIAAVEGIITCPLHGLRIDAQTGIVVPA